MKLNIIAVLFVITIIIFSSIAVAIEEWNDPGDTGTVDLGIGATSSEPSTSAGSTNSGSSSSGSSGGGGGFWGTGVGRAISGFLGLFGISVGTAPAASTQPSGSSSSGGPTKPLDPTLEAFKDQGGCDRAGTCETSGYAVAQCGGQCESYQTDKGFGAYVSGEGSRTEGVTASGTGGTGTFTCTVVGSGLQTGSQPSGGTTTNSEPDRSLEGGGNF